MRTPGHHPRQRGIALITTLLMLSVVTLMAVTFLAVSRRERASVTTSTDRLEARAMADAGLQRAEAEIISRVQAASNLLSYDFLVSTNFINGAGFVPNNTNIGNVSFVYPNGAPVEGDDLLQLYRNLQVDPRPPVFIRTNAATGEEDFRFFLDFNRNGRFETNGVIPELDDRGRFLGVTNFFTGDPEYIGVLRRPDQPHSGSNLFVGRFAYLVLPVGKSLDLNFLHNHTKGTSANLDGFLRNQGMGSWELNFAAFLRDLNTNAWPTYFYRTNLGTSSDGLAFDNAHAVVRQRYRINPADPNPSYANLASFANLYGGGAGLQFAQDGLDGYSDGPLQLDLGRPYTDGGGGTFRITDNDNTGRAWPGAPNPAQYFDPQELFSVSEPASTIDQFTNRLIGISTRLSTYDRYTFYRLLSQLGTDSVPANRDRVHLNYDNRLDLASAPEGALPGPALGYHATNFVRWTASAFVTNAADRILKALHPVGNARIPQIAVTNVPVWPTNYYSPAVHRAVQLAVNIFDATTNRAGGDFPQFPTVFRPVFGNDPRVTGGLRIEGFEDITDDWENLLWGTQHYDIDEDERRPNIRKYDRVAGIPAVIGAREGYPNFNEFELQTMAVASRKLELVKRSPTSRPAFTNQLYTLGISNVFGVEFWNSYERPFPRALELRVRLQFELVLSNDTRVIWARRGGATNVQTIPADQWQGREFRLPVYTNVLFLPNSAYRNLTGQFLPLSTNRPLSLFEPGIGFPVPTWRLMVTNRLQAALVDTSVAGGRLVDYVDLDNLNSVIDITEELFGNVSQEGQVSTLGSFWLTNRIGGVPQGIQNQVLASMGSLSVAQWNSASAEPIQGQDKEKAVERFREFVGLVPPSSSSSPTLRMQAPFSPGIKLLHNKSWQVNDPLVNDLYWDLEDPARSNVIERLPPLFPVTTERSNLGKINYRYRPWQRNLYSSGDPTDFAVAVKDPQITKSDDWDFPTNSLPNPGWLGRIHRGTPWQTVYLKAPPVSPQQWRLWSGHPDWTWPGGIVPLGTHPTNDWAVLDLFTTAVNDNAARGLLSVNQAGLAAWSAVLSGVPVITNLFATNIGPALIQPNTDEVRRIVEGINMARRTRFGQKFNYLGEILSTPELTTASPFLTVAPTQNGAPPDAVVERIPQMVMSLLKSDEPRFVVLAYGQSLRPAPDSVVTDFGTFFQMPTNYTITGEYVTKTLMRLERFQDIDPATGQPRTRIRAVKESYNEVPPTE